MPIPSSLVGATAAGFPSSVDSRWAMNFAAGIDDLSPILYDTTAERLPVHPMYLGFPEWEATKLIAEMVNLDESEQGRGVQVTHDTRIHRPFEVGMELITTAAIVGVHRHRAGAFQTVRHETRTVDGELVATSYLGAIHRGVEVDGDDVRPPLDQRPQAPGETEGRTIELPVPANACHTYSECARIYNAFHCDIAVAKSVGVDGLILHGTGTIARAISAILGEITGGDPTRVTRVAADLKGMVVVPDVVSLTYRPFTDEATGRAMVNFEALNSRGDRAITAGLIEFAN